MSMTLGELIERLEEIRDNLPEDTDPDTIEVRLTYQPNYPLEGSLRGVVFSPDDLDGADEDEDDRVTDRTPIVYLAEGQGIGYGSTAVFNACKF
jgi:hypothetical protein